MQNFGVPFGNEINYDTKTTIFTSYRNYNVAKPHNNSAFIVLNSALTKKTAEAVFFLLFNTSCLNCLKVFLYFVRGRLCKERHNNDKDAGNDKCGEKLIDSENASEGL